MKLLLVLLAAFSFAAIAVDATVFDISAEDNEDEVLLGEAPPDEPCGFKQFVRETLTPLGNYGPNVCRRRAIYRESRSECNFRRVCRKNGAHFYCWYACRGTKRCVTYQTSYTFQPTCCKGFASAIDAGVVNRTTIDTDQILRTQGCPVADLETLRATCVLQGDVHGNITIMQPTPDQDAVITGVVEGLTPGLHGFHIHQYGSILGGCGAAGGHYNPFGVRHGAPDDETRHVGALGNIEADSNGVANINIVDRMVKLYGPISVDGRSFVIHNNTDDLGHGGVSDSLTTGRAGSRVGCCTIGIARGS